MTAVQTFEDYGTNNQWHAIGRSAASPGLTLSFTLPTDTPVNVSAFGVVSASSLGMAMFRFLIDGIPTGFVYPTELRLDAGSSGDLYWRIERDLELPAGTHTVVAEIYYNAGVSQFSSPGKQSTLKVRY